MFPFEHDTREWLETDGLGGFASGTVCGIRTRRYHALLLTATQPPAGRVVLVNGLEAWVETPQGTFPISTQQYAGPVVWPQGQQTLKHFAARPWPTWEFALTDTLAVRQELFQPRDVSGVALRWTLAGAAAGVRLHVRPLLSGRDYHSLHHENSEFRFEHEVELCQDSRRHLAEHEVCTTIAWQPYATLPRIWAEANGDYEPRPEWYRNFVYEQEQQRGLDGVEDLASPGEFHWDLSAGEAVLLLGTARPFSDWIDDPHAPPRRVFSYAEVGERKRRTATSGVELAAYDYFARRGDGTTIIAGYPWFTDWGRDTFIALRGLCLSPERLGIARQILLAWSSTVSRGMLPNRFPDQGDEPEYNSVDASLWYIIAVHDYLAAMRKWEHPVAPPDSDALLSAVDAILTGYARGTRFGIRLEDDGLLAAGEPGTQLTWMDAKVGDWVVTPRIGKPVEVQALWLNALWIGSQVEPAWSSILDRGLASFGERFWHHAGGYLHDVVDVGHRQGEPDPTFRPNQIFAIGGLPLPLLAGERARQVVDAVEARLLTPWGLRSLDPQHPDYRPRYEGGVWQRDGAYHQGTVWPWLLGPFVEAWVRVRGGTNEAKQMARERFVEPLLRHLADRGLGHLAEIADAEPPHLPRGCPFQAWSLGELLRLTHQVLVPDSCGPELPGAESAATRDPAPANRPLPSGNW